MESVTSARFCFTAMCVSLYVSKTVASLQLCHAELTGVTVLWLLTKCNRASRRVLLIVHCYAPSLLSDIRAGGGVYAGQQVLVSQCPVAGGLVEPTREVCRPEVAGGFFSPVLA